MSFFKTATLLPEDPILNLQIIFNADPRPHKINLGIGAYKDAEGRPIVLNAIKKAEIELLRLPSNKEYLPIEGNQAYIQESLKLIFGEEICLSSQDRIIGAQTIGGSGALRVAGELFLRLTNKRIFLSDPTWSNHHLIFNRTGLSVESYPYYDIKHKKIQFSYLCDAIEKMPENSVIVLHACCHNPTGMDPTEEQWHILSQKIKKQKLIPFFDLAYQGLGIGIEEDAKPIRLFVADGHELFVASSYSKNMGLYGERVGMLSCLLNDEQTIAKIKTHLKQIIRGIYSTPPLHGSQITTMVLQNPALRQDWLGQLKMMRERIHAMRNAFAAGLLARNSPIDFSFMRSQKGIFSFSGLDIDQVTQLKEEHAIYMPSNGRINVAGLNPTNLNTVIDAIISVIEL